MAMTRKHYVEVASILKSELNELASLEHLDDDEHEIATETVKSVANRLAVMFKRDNPYFDRTRFMNAAGLGDPNGN